MKNPFKSSLRRNYDLSRQTFQVAGVRGLACALYGKTFDRTFRLTVRHPLAREPFLIRCPTSDIAACDQVFYKQEYDFRVSREPQVIVDAGANIGLASIAFATRFPSARVIAIEPEESNVELLRSNTRNYANVEVLHGALWYRDELLHVVDPGFGKWGFVTESAVSRRPAGFTGAQKTQGVSVPTLMAEFGIQHIDVFKIDIEGAEKEIFANCNDWIGRTEAIIVELHEHMKPGCTATFAAATLGFGDAWQRGENEFRVRQGGCITRA